jgi:hypothetical protein
MGQGAAAVFPPLSPCDSGAMTEREGDRKDRPPGGGGKQQDRRARQAAALRRNLARRKAQSRSRGDEGGSGSATDTDGPKR